MLAGGLPGSFQQGIIVGSFACSILQVACYKVAKTVTEQVVREALREGKLAGLVNMLAGHMTIQDTQVGCEIEDLKPAAGHVEADGLFDKLDEQWQSVVDLFDPSIVVEAMEKEAMARRVLA